MVHKSLSFFKKTRHKSHTPISHMSSDPLDALVSIITSCVKDLQSSYGKHGLSVPSLDDPIAPGPLDGDDKTNETVRLIVAAATQLIATVRHPRDTVWEQGPSMYLSALLAFVVDVDIPDILHEAPNGVRNLLVCSYISSDNCFRLLKLKISLPKPTAILFISVGLS